MEKLIAGAITIIIIYALLRAIIYCNTKPKK